MENRIEDAKEVFGGELEDLDPDYYNNEIASGLIVDMGSTRKDFIEIVQYDNRIIVEHDGKGATYFNSDSVEFSSEIDNDGIEVLKISSENAMWRATRYVGKE